MSSNLNNHPVGYSPMLSGTSTPGGHRHHVQHQQNQQTDHRENTRSFNEKFKAFFKGFGKQPTVVASGSAGLGVQGPGNHPQSIEEDVPKEILLTEELLDDLSFTRPMPTRLRALQTITDTCKNRIIEPYSFEKLWIETQDIFKCKDSAARHMCFLTFTTIFKLQTDKAGYLRARVFAFIKNHDKLEDTVPKFQLLKAVSNNGREMGYYEERMSPFLLTWLLSGELHGSQTREGVKVEECIGLINTVLRFNATFMEDDILGGFIQHVCLTALACNDAADILPCIHFLNNVISYAMIPPNTLQTVMATLCRLVNLGEVCFPAWKLMRNLLGTFLGSSCLFILIKFMNTDAVLNSNSSRGSNNQATIVSNNGADGNVENGDSREESSITMEMDSVIRGAVFITGMTLWGGNNRIVRTLTRSASAGGDGGGIVGVVLAAYDKVLARQSPQITYEVLCRVEELIQNSADSLQVIGWDLVLQIMRKLIDYSKQQEYRANSSVVSPTSSASADQQRQQNLRNNKILLKHIHDTLDLIEAVLPTKTFCGSVNKYWETVVEPVCHARPIPSIKSLLKHKYIRLLDSSSTQFLPNLVQFSLLHFQREIRTPFRLQALEYIKKICLLNQDCMEESLLDNVILPSFKNIDAEPDPLVRQHCVQFIVEFLMDSRSLKGHDLLRYVEKVVNRPFELERELLQAQPNKQHNMSMLFTEADVSDIFMGIQGIIRIFQRKIYSLPSSIAVTAFKILVRHLEKHYKPKQNCLENCASIRFQIFDCFFRIRANALYHLGFPTDQGEVTCYSSYLAVDHKDTSSDSSYPITTMDHSHGGGISPPTIAQGDPKGGGGGPHLVSYISLTAACKQVICSLKKERDWKILELILHQLPLVMENKALILSKHGNDVDSLASQLCYMVTDKTLFSDNAFFRNTPTRFSRSDFQARVFPALTSLVSYHSSLDTKIQQQIVKCLEHGLVYMSSSRICISALTTCTLEMKEVMHKMIPEILLSLSKISPKKDIAIPVLEFLSTLIHLPRVFHSFVSDQYMSIFAICLPYTNPFKFNHYVVSLAHHVIALWFLKCRLSFRKGFVSYIIKGLESNVWAPYMEASEKLERNNEDSSSRKRSSSLTDQSNRRRERVVSGQASVQGLSRQSSYQPVDARTIQFHQELTETCVDLMARYAFADCSPLPSRFESSGWLIQHGGNSQSWIIDNRIITIATSSCTTREMKDGLCDRCWVVCKHNQYPGVQNKRSLLVGQHSYDEQEVRGEGNFTLGGGGVAIRRSNTISGGQHHQAGGPMRRRHRSAMVQQGQQPQRGEDDLLLENKLQLPSSSSQDGGIGGGGGSSASTFSSTSADSSGRSTAGSGGGRKERNSVCMCWCQGWAEIMIRRPTGNTSWMMRVQNVVGGAGYSHDGEKLVSNLSGLFVHDIVEEAKRELEDIDGVVVAADSSKTSREDLVDKGPSQAGSLEEMSLSTSCSIEGASASTTSASTPDKGQMSPTTTTTTIEDATAAGGDVNKMPVKRSNSSPEMTKGSNNSPLEQDQEDSQKGPSYLPSCVPIPEETSRKSESEGEGAPAVRTTVSASASPPETPHDSQHMLLTPIRRDRLSTISVMTPARKNSIHTSAARRMMSAGSGDTSRPSITHGAGSDPGIRSGISPSFVFLQLCGHGVFGAHHGASNKPLLLPSNDSTTTSLKVLDYIPPYETHKIGVLYVGPGQAKKEAQIFQNSHGSVRYRDFLQGLGTLIKLTETDPQKTFLGGLDGRGVEDGNFAYIWRDDVMQVIFHVATLMPTKLQSDPNGNGKKRHIGNDFVAIVYNNSDEEFDINTIKCQFLYACVIIQPLDHRTNRVFVKAKPDLGENIANTDVKIVSDQNLPIMARQLALHSNLASVIHKKLSQNTEPYASNWLERLRAIKRLRQRLLPADAGQGGSSLNGATGGLSVSAQELNDSLGTALLGAGGISQPGAPNPASGSTGNVLGAAGANANAGLQKRNSFVVDDFTEYV